MHHSADAAIIVNDLDSLIIRIEALPPHPEYTKAMLAVQDAKTAILNGRVNLHQSEMRERFAKAS